MKIDKNNKTIYAYHWERCTIANYLAHCTTKDEKWKVVFCNDTDKKK